MPRSASGGLVWAVWLVSTGVLAGPAEAQESTSAPLASELVELMTSGELDALAARDSIDEDRFVAALAFPGQLLVVSARYEVPLYVEQKIANRQYRDVYIDLNAASLAGTKMLITDSGANGLHGDDASAVDVVDTGAGVVRLDGARSGGALSAGEYQRAVADADEQYARMLTALIAQAR